VYSYFVQYQDPSARPAGTQPTQNKVSDTLSLFVIY